MKKIILVFVAALLLGACSTTSDFYLDEGSGVCMENYKEYVFGLKFFESTSESDECPRGQR